MTNWRPRVSKLLQQLGLISVEQRSKRHRVEPVAVIAQITNRKFALENKSFMVKNADVLGLNKMGFMVFHFPHPEGGSERNVSEIGGKIMKDFETSKLGGSGFDIYGATT
jgi:hypothetical protein